jgi:hypothetical protein
MAAGMTVNLFIAKVGLWTFDHSSSRVRGQTAGKTVLFNYLEVFKES